MAWVRPLRSSPSSSPSSSPLSSPLRSRRSLSFFWWLFVLIFGVGADIGCSVCLRFFFFLVAVADIGGRWLICGGGRWLWAVAVWVVVDDSGDGIIYYFNV